jgi:hypothetical protein
LLGRPFVVLRKDTKLAAGSLGKEYGEISADRCLSVFTGLDQRVHGGAAAGRAWIRETAPFSLGWVRVKVDGPNKD